MVIHCEVILLESISIFTIYNFITGTELEYCVVVHWEVILPESILLLHFEFLLDTSVLR